MAQRCERVRGFAGLADGHHQRARIRHGVAVAVFTRDLDLGRDLGDALQPVFGGAAAVIAGAAGQYQHGIHFLEHAMRPVAEELGHDALHALQRVRYGARLLEDFLLHVVAVGSQFGRATVRLHGLDRARGRLVGLVDHPIPAQLHVHQVALFQVDDLVGYARKRHGVAGQEVLAAFLSHAQDQRRAGTGTDHPVRLVLAENGDRIRAVQLRDACLHRLEQVALVQAVDQVADHLGIGLAAEVVALGLERSTQFIVVFDDAVVGQGNASGLAAGALARAMAEVGMSVVHGGRAMGGPARMGNAGGALEMLLLDLGQQFGDPVRAAGAFQAIGVHRHAARVIAAVFEPLQALDQDGDDIAG